MTAYDYGLTYKRPNRRKCYWLCPDCLKGRKGECSYQCPDYISIARAERIRRDAQVIREKSSLGLHQP